jgi:hydroxymethylpyrimidine pyrophosphatase-like HAD family hydrolase
MTLPIQLISTDFDGTLFAEFDEPPIPEKLQTLLGGLQARGVKWIINTGRDMPSLMKALARARISTQPDYLVLVEREIYFREGSEYRGMEPWNSQCARDHTELFARIQLDLPRLAAWINARFRAKVYEDAYSPLCLLAGNNGDAVVICDYLNDYCRTVPHLTLVRNDVYARFSHAAYNKGTALAEITRVLGLSREQVFAVGDHWNDLPMLSSQHAYWLAAPKNAVDAVKATVRRQKGHVSDLSHGAGVAHSLEFHLRNAAPA